jgi:hypothetical protein
VKEVHNMNVSSRLSIAGLAIAGALGLGATGASAQAVYVNPYVQPYPVVVAPGYVAPAPIVAPPAIVRERTVVISRPGYVRAPAYGVAVPRYDYYGGYDYAGYDYADW